MLVTHKDVLIANYSINSYRKIDSKKLAYKLFIYANCLSQEQKKIYFPKWRQNSNVEIFDNIDKVKNLNLKKWETIISPEGIERIRDDNNENYDELWTTELKKIDTEFHATVDSDFEIINPSFIYSMINHLDNNKNTIAISTDYNNTIYDCFESYSGLTVTLWERWNTWFCIYKKQALKCNTSHFFYKIEHKHNVPVYFDSASFFQKKLREDFNWNLMCIDNKYQTQFIHYGAFSKNLSINKFNIILYRKLRILQKILTLNEGDFQILDFTLNKYLLKIVNKLYRTIFSKIDGERKTYN